MKIGDKTRRKGRVKQRRQSGHCFDFRAIKSFKQKQMARIVAHEIKSQHPKESAEL